jgi:hypothetical protein
LNNLGLGVSFIIGNYLFLCIHWKPINVRLSW